RRQLAARARDGGIVHEADVEAVAVDGEDPEVAAQAVAHRRKIVEHRVRAPDAARGDFDAEQANRRAVGPAVQVLAHGRAPASGVCHDGTASSSPSAAIASSACPVSPPPHGFSRGKRARSITTMRCFSDGSRRTNATAVDTPAGPAPAMTTSYSRTREL